MLPIGTRLKFYQNTGSSLLFGPVTNGLTNTIVSDANGSGTLYDSNGATVPGCTGVTAFYTANGIYQFAFNGASFNPPQGEAYWFIITLTSPTAGSGPPGGWGIPVTVLTYSGEG